LKTLFFRNVPFVKSSPHCALDAVDVTFLLPSLLPIGGAKVYGLALMIAS
jgi:hypothetical protein